MEGRALGRGLEDGTQAPGKGLLQRLGGEVAKMQPGAVRSRKAIRFSFCPSDEHRGDS